MRTLLRCPHCGGDIEWPEAIVVRVIQRNPTEDLATVVNVAKDLAALQKPPDTVPSFVTQMLTMSQNQLTVESMLEYLRNTYPNDEYLIASLNDLQTLIERDYQPRGAK